MDRLDSGTSAVLAGSITALVSLGGHFVTYRHGRRQLVSEAQLQLREPRKRAYNDFLVVCRDTLDAIWDLVDEETREADAGRLSAVIEQYTPTLQRTLGAVDLEGPEDVSEAAHAVWDAFGELHVSAVIWDKSGGDVDDDGRPIGFGGNITAGIRGPLHAYVTAAQKALTTFAD